MDRKNLKESIGVLVTENKEEFELSEGKLYFEVEYIPTQERRLSTDDTDNFSESNIIVKLGYIKTYNY